MKEILGKLHQDHINVAKLLDLYEKQLKILKKGGNPNYIILRDIMKYMRCYPDVVHHPLEEVIFEKLEEKNKAIADKVHQLYREHKQIDDIGNNLAEILSTIAAGVITSLTEFLENSEKYLQLMRSHMNLEEGEIFPEINKYFTDKDWESVDLVLAKQSDPLFGHKIEEEYQSLYESVLSDSGV